MDMPTHQEAAEEFLSHKRIAVAGVSRNGGTHAGNGIYTRLRDVGYEVFAVNPNADTVMGEPCYRSLGDIPGGVDGVVIATNPRDSLSVAQEAHALGISRVWFHKNVGTTSYSREAHDYCRANGITALVSCPLWYGQCSDGFHRVFGSFCRTFGRVPKEV
jgi:predicted CoA-binding protein